VERVIGIDDVRQDVAMLRTPDGNGRIELAMFGPMLLEELVD